MTKDESDWSNGEANYEELEPLFQSSAIASNSSSPPTTSLITEQQLSGMSEKSDVSDSFSEELELRSKSSKRTNLLPAPVFSECVLWELLIGYQSQFASMAEEVMRLKEKVFWKNRESDET